MTLNNINHLTDQNGNPVVDFVWGNMPMQPNDARPDVAPDATTTVLGQTVANNGRLSTTAASSKNPHFIALGGWNAFPLFSGNTKGFFTGSAYTYTPYITVPDVRTLSTNGAKDALKDQGYVDANITVASAGAGGSATISNVAVTSNVATITANGHSFQVGDVVTVWGFTTTNAPLNGNWIITGVATNTFTFATPATATISTNAATGYCIISGTRWDNIQAIQLTSNVATVTAPGHSFVVGDVVGVSGATTSALNVTGKTVTAVTTDTVSFALTNADIAYTVDATGIITAVGTVAIAKAKAVASFGISTDGTVITINTSTAHGFNAGDLVNLNGLTASGLNATGVGTVAIASVISSTAFTIAKPAGYTVPTALSITAAVGDGSKITYTSTNSLTAGQVVAVTGLQQVIATQTPTLNAPGAVTFTTSTAHGLAVGNTVTIAGTAASAASTTTLYNGTFVVSGVPSTTSFTVTNLAATAQSTSNGVASSYPITTAGTVQAADGSGLNQTGVVLSAGLSGSAFAVSSSVTATSSAVAGSGKTLLVSDTTGQAVVGAKTGFIKTQSVTYGTASVGLGASITITPYN